MILPFWRPFYCHAFADTWWLVHFFSFRHWDTDVDITTDYCFFFIGWLRHFLHYAFAISFDSFHLMPAFSQDASPLIIDYFLFSILFYEAVQTLPFMPPRLSHDIKYCDYWCHFAILHCYLSSLDYFISLQPPRLIISHGFILTSRHIDISLPPFRSTLPLARLFSLRHFFGFHWYYLSFHY